jgi:excinuclease UvrABC helicase subunit UvrB
MPIARFQFEDGRVGRFEVPDGTTPEQAQAQIEQLVASQEQAAPASQPTATRPAAPQVAAPQAQQTIGPLLQQFEAAKNQGDFQTAEAIRQQIEQVGSGEFARRQKAEAAMVQLQQTNVRKKAEG